MATKEKKFRAWNIEKKIMHDIAFPSWNGMIEVWEDNKPQSKVEYLSIGGPENQGILLQYTGLSDKNGKEIWEGDIVKKEQGKYIWHYEIGTVKGFGNNLYLIIRYRNFEEDEEFGYKFGDFHFKGEQGRDELIGAEREIEIIGNIYENPELLK